MKNLKVALAIVGLSISAHSMAAPITHTIQLDASVPTTTFHVLPVHTDWIGNTQTLQFNPTTGDLTSLTKPFDVVHTAGSISGKLLNPAILSYTSTNIPLTVKFNNVTLTTADQEVVNSAQAAARTQVNLEIIPTKPSTGYEPGDYNGNVQLSFDAVI